MATLRGKGKDAGDPEARGGRRERERGAGAVSAAARSAEASPPHLLRPGSCWSLRRIGELAHLLEIPKAYLKPPKIS